MSDEHNQASPSWDSPPSGAEGPDGGWNESGGGPPRRVVIGACIIVLAAACVWLILGRKGEAPPPAEEEEAAAGQAVIVDEEEPLADPQVSADREVVLFFSREGRSGLYPESRRIIVTASLTEQARQVIEELIRGPRRALNIAVIPPHTEVRQIFLDREGNAYVDFSAELASKHPGGTECETATLYAVVNSLTYNFPEIRSVQLLVEGEERETLAGHIDLARRYYRDLSKVEPDALERLTGAGGPGAQR